MTNTKNANEDAAAPTRSGRRRYSAAQKKALLDEAAAPGSSIAITARRHGISPSVLFRWKRIQDDGGLAGLRADERVVGETEVKQLQARVRELERLLGKKTMEVEILKEASEYSRGKGWLLPRTSSGSGGSR